MTIVKFILLALFTLSTSIAADLPALEKLFTDNYDNFYQPRFCGKNVARLVEEARKRNIDLSNSYVLKIVGAGFLETSGFYTRSEPNERVMLGYFHMILVADGHVFDFDMNEPLVLKLEDYVRLQFSPPYEPYRIWGMTYNTREHLTWWTVTRFEWADYVRNKEIPTWKKKMGEYVDLDFVVSLPRLR